MESKKTLRKALTVIDENTIDSTPKIKRGFASMSPEKRKELSSKGGKISKGGGRRAKSEDGKKDNQTVLNNKRGFASMDVERRKKIASMGGKTSKGGGRPSKNNKETIQNEAQKEKLLLSLGAYAPAKIRKTEN